MTVSTLPPGPPRGLPGRQLFAFRRDPLSFLTGAAREYGDVVRLRFGPRSVFLISHPELIRDVLVTNHRNFHKGRGLERAKRLLGEGLLTSEGELHLRQRRLAQPAFHRQRIAAYAGTMTAAATRRRDLWHDGEGIDVAREMMELTLGIAGRTLFDADVEGEAREIGEALGVAFESFRFAMLPFTELLDRLPLPSVLRFERARARLDATIYRMIAERRRSGVDRGDFLSMLLLARDTEGDGGRMSDEQLRDEAMTIFLAGHETTANMLTWTWYLLSQHPMAEARLHAELDAVLGTRAPEADDLPRLPVARAMLAESMRLYPPAWIIGRRAKEDFDLGGWRLPARAILLMSQWVVHRDPRFWSEPGAFRPERWESEADRPRFAYFPFGGGPRQCIGEHFAWMEGVLVLSTIAQRWRLRLVPGHQVATLPLITLRPRFGMRMTVHRRAPGAA